MTARASSMHKVSSKEKKKTRPIGLKVQSEVMTHDLFALKNGTKLRKFPLGGVTESESANQRRE